MLSFKLVKRKNRWSIICKKTKKVVFFGTRLEMKTLLTQLNSAIEFEEGLY